MHLTNVRLNHWPAAQTPVKVYGSTPVQRSTDRLPSMIIVVSVPKKIGYCKLTSNSAFFLLTLFTARIGLSTPGSRAHSPSGRWIGSRKYSSVYEGKASFDSRKSGHLFIFAKTALRFSGNPQVSDPRRMNTLLGMGKATCNPYPPLDNFIFKS